MTSAIDPTKPADGLPASKADLRVNLEAARSELNHGGFVEGFTPSNYGPAASSQVSHHLAALDDALGALGEPGSFAGLADTPGAYTGEASKFVKVKADESGLEFVTSGGATNADAVNYSPPWSGINTRSVQARLMDEAHVEDFGATGNGTADDAGAIQEAIDSPAQWIVFGPREYRIGTRIIIPQGKTLIFKGCTLGAHSNLPTSGDTSALLYFDGSTQTDHRGNAIIGMARMRGDGATYGILIGGGQSRFDIYGSTITFEGNFFSSVRFVNGGWFNFRMRGVRCVAGATRSGGVAIDLQDTNGTTMILQGVNVGLNENHDSATRGFRLESETIHMDSCSVDGVPAGGAAVECVQNSLGGHVTATNFHFEGNEGFLVKLGPHTNNQFHMFGGLVHAPAEHTGTLFDVGSNATLTLNHVRFRAFTNWSTFATIGSGGQVKVYEGTRDLSASSPWNQFTGSGAAFQMWEGKRINLHNSP